MRQFDSWAATAPQTLQRVITNDSWLRIRISEEEKKNLRLQIASAKHGGSAHLSLTPNQIAVLCKLSGASVVSSQRLADRVGTTKYRDLVLEARSLPSSYRVLDISKGGARIGVPRETQEEHFPLGKYLERGLIRLGKKAGVAPLDMIPRGHYDGAVGMEVVVDPKGHSRKILEIFLEHLAQKELAVHAAEAGG